ncbi:hypothetical protein CF319_g3232 [Tilletia indica]|nr:hypothetical protein CF319_g3232 [Tilletia indica]KAE8231947.1 hypothetical protein CF326_g3034 [Tilletia indica]
MPIPSHHLSIRPITPSTPFRPHPLLQNTTHPAIGQNGLFAEVPLPPRTLICPYLGTVHGEAETDERSEYDAKVWAREGEVEGLEVGGGDVGLGIDATYAGNVARFVNDFRGIAQRANVTFEDWPSSSSSSDNDNGNDDKGTRPCPQQQARGLALYTGPAGVPAGAELCVSYGKAFWEARGVLPATSRPP